MIKVIPANSFDFGMPIASLVHVHARGVDKAWMHKRASAMSEAIRNVRPEDGHAFIHLISMGAMEAFGTNRNGDAFNEKSGSFELAEPKQGSPKRIELAGGLIEYHPTFSKHAHVFRHHKNSDPSLKIGDVVAEDYNGEMKRGELIIKVPVNKEWEEDLQKLAEGKDLAFSMSCKVPHDLCSACGNKAASRADYCDHLSKQMTDILKSGHQVFAINDKPMFFDISKVIKPADRIAYSLQKVASAAVMGGAELAEELGVRAPQELIYTPTKAAAEKLALARKLAEIEKMIDAAARGQDNAHLKALLPACPHEDMPEDELGSLAQGASLSSILSGLSDAKILLSFRDFLKLLRGPQGSLAGDECSGQLPGLYTRLLDSGEADECVADGAYDPSHTSVPRRAQEAIGRLAGEHSLAEGPTQKRIRVTIIRGTAPKMPDPSPVKAAAVSNTAHAAREYAKYQLSFLKAAGGTDLVSGLTVLKNYLTV
jgi:hypothetical protein